jgi:hypothetical protein
MVLPKFNSRPFDSLIHPLMTLLDTLKRSTPFIVCWFELVLEQYQIDLTILRSASYYGCRVQRILDKLLLKG